MKIWSIILITVFCISLKLYSSQPNQTSTSSKPLLSFQQWQALFRLEEEYEEHLERLELGQCFHFEPIFLSMEIKAESIKNHVYGYIYGIRIQEKREHVATLIAQKKIREKA